ncbi:MAG: hypothetical protein WC846_04905 [Candidatus Gracilibacteria bacterium]|jgi:hypothetical protein
MRKTTIISSLLFLLILTSCTVASPVVPVTEDPTESTLPEQVTLKGTYVCIPHKDGSELAENECARGIQTEDGKYYGFDTGLSSVGPNGWDFKAGESLIAAGVLRTPTEDLSIISGVRWEEYPIEWIFMATVKLKHESNFIFSYGVGGKNEINTVQGTFTKDMIVEASIQISLDLSDEEIQSVLDKIEELNLKEDPIRDSVYVVSPCESYSLDLTFSSLNTSMEWDCENMSEDRMEFVNFMMKLIDSQEEIKALPEPQAGYS